MTQKEYREKIKQYEDEIVELRIQLDKAKQTSQRCGHDRSCM